MIPKQLQKKQIKFCRIKIGTKKPFEKEWTKKPYSYQEISKFLPKENYGVQCGYGNLAVIDCDEEALQIIIDRLLPMTYKIKTGGGGTHNYFFIPELEEKIILETSDGIHLGEVQSHGTQVVGPGSIHPNGKKYTDINQEKIATISFQELFNVIKNFMKKIQEAEEDIEYEKKTYSKIDDLSVANIWGIAGLKKHGSEYYGSHPIHGSEGGMNFWINPPKNAWHCFRCDSGGGVLAAIAVKEGLIKCSDAQKGALRGSKAKESINLAKEKYGFKEIEEAEESKADDEIDIIWDNELQNWEEEEKEWIIDKLIPSRSVCILAGKRGTLKTFIALLIGYSVASGNDFLDHFSTRKGGVIYLDKENGIPIMKKRTNMLKNGMELNGKDLRIGFICFSQLKVDKEADIEKIEKLIEKHKPLLLIIDTYRRGISFDENDAGAVSALFVDILRPLVEKHNISALLIHHNRKSAGIVPDEMDELRGSSDLANYADIILKMERKSGNVILKQLKNRNAQEIKPVKIRVEFGESHIKMIYEGEYQKQGPAEKCVELLTIWIAENEIKQFRTKDAKDKAFQAGIKETNFKTALILMQDTGIIENIGFGLYDVKNN